MHTALRLHDIPCVCNPSLVHVSIPDSAEANRTSCRIAEVPMRPEAWNIAYGDWNVAWERQPGAPQGVMRVNLAGTTGAVSGYANCLLRVCRMHAMLTMQLNGSWVPGVCAAAHLEQCCMHVVCTLCQQAADCSCLLGFYCNPQ